MWNNLINRNWRFFFHLYLRFLYRDLLIRHFFGVNFAFLGTDWFDHLLINIFSHSFINLFNSILYLVYLFIHVVLLYIIVDLLNHIIVNFLDIVLFDLIIYILIHLFVALDWHLFIHRLFLMTFLSHNEIFLFCIWTFICRLHFFLFLLFLLHNFSDYWSLSYVLINKCASFIPLEIDFCYDSLLSRSYWTKPNWLFELI